MARLLGSALFIATIVATVAAAQSTQPRTPPLALESLAGRDSFGVYCASCHGADGTGHGPAASALRTQPADLTILARRNGGVFPRDASPRSSTGRAVRFQPTAAARCRSGA